jgi:hypothetical protein
LIYFIDIVSRVFFLKILSGKIVIRVLRGPDAGREFSLEPVPSGDGWEVCSCGY